MRILYIADGRSPISLNWIKYFVSENEVHLVSSFACEPEPGLASSSFIPIAFSNLRKRKKLTISQVENNHPVQKKTYTVRSRMLIRQWLGPLTIPTAGRQLARLIDHLQPDLIHALRIPYEGMMATAGIKRVRKTAPPLMISVWGNDFTLHATANPWMKLLTCQVLQNASGLHTDCQRDLRLARQWGFSKQKPAIVLPGGGGIQLDLFHPPTHHSSIPTIINARGVRAYVRNDTFFTALPAVLREMQDVCIICPGMLGDSQVEEWIRDLNLTHSVDLLPVQSRNEMASLFQRSWITVSPTIHDGTPNTLLEAMACGCFPIVGDLESLREWITPGENGLLFDPTDSKALAAAILKALSSPDLREKAAKLNQRLIAEKAAYNLVMNQAVTFYNHLVHK